MSESAMDNAYTLQRTKERAQEIDNAVDLQPSNEETSVALLIELGFPFHENITRRNQVIDIFILIMSNDDSLNAEGNKCFVRLLLSSGAKDVEFTKNHSCLCGSAPKPEADPDCTRDTSTHHWT